MKITLLLALLTALPLSATTIDVIQNGGFETPQIAINDYCYFGLAVPGHICTAPYTGWSGTVYEEGNGINDFGATFHNGSQALILQNASNAAQTFVTGAGAYTLTWFDVTRAGSPGIYSVYLDNALLQTYNPSGSWTQRTFAGTLTEGPHTLLLQGVAYTTDSTAFLDDVSLVAEAVPEPDSALLLFGAGMLLLGKMHATRRK